MPVLSNQDGKTVLMHLLNDKVEPDHSILKLFKDRQAYQLQFSDGTNTYLIYLSDSNYEKVRSMAWVYANKTRGIIGSFWKKVRELSVVYNVRTGNVTSYRNGVKAGTELD